MAFVRDLMRFSSQHRTLYCYLCLSLWIFLLIAGMYKYMSTSDGFALNAFRYGPSRTVPDAYARVRRQQADCNAAAAIVRGDDGGILNGWKLHGVMLVTRHGDRGPMSHVRNINAIDCGAGRQPNPLLHKYRTFLLNATANGPAAANQYSRSGPFHNFALLPAFTKACLLGQLTYGGVAQLLQTGDILRQVYGHQLDVLRPTVAARSGNATQPQPSYVADEFLVYATRYRRTFQSAMALLYGFVPERWHTVAVHESHSLAFCFGDCACARADQIKDALAKEAAARLDQHPTVDAIVQWVGASILQNPAPKMQALEVRDALLALICHGAALPCRRGPADYADVRAAEVAAPPPPASTTEPSDLINIDQDDGTGQRDGGVAAQQQQQQSAWQSGRTAASAAAATRNDIDPEPGCVDVGHVAAIMAYTQQQAAQEAKHRLNQHQSILRAYGLIRNIVANMLKIISGDRLKFVLYAGHDRTIQFLFGALGVYRASGERDAYFVPYAARVAFELYKSEAGNGDLSEYYFRVVSDGLDITNRIEVCEGGRSLRIVKDGRGNKADLCPVENIIRFIHDDYFNALNATNQKEACQMQKNSDF